MCICIVVQFSNYAPPSPALLLFLYPRSPRDLQHPGRIIWPISSPGLILPPRVNIQSGHWGGLISDSTGGIYTRIVPLSICYNQSGTNNAMHTTSAIQPPPGRDLVLPRPWNPRPAENPSIFNDAMSVRQKVFIEEQGVAAEAEIDSDDARSWQWVLYRAGSCNGDRTNGADASRTPVAVIRLVPPPQAPHEALTHPEKAKSLPEYDLAHEPCVKLTRVAVVPEYRGKGLGRELVEMALEWVRRNAREIDDAWARALGETQAKRWTGLVLVHAQVDVEKMYERLGFETDQTLGRWDEEGIEHVGMWRRMEIQS